MLHASTRLLSPHSQHSPALYNCPGLLPWFIGHSRHFEAPAEWGTSAGFSALHPLCQPSSLKEAAMRSLAVTLLLLLALALGGSVAQSPVIVGLTGSACNGLPGRNLGECAVASLATIPAGSCRPLLCHKAPCREPHARVDQPNSNWELAPPARPPARPLCRRHADPGGRQEPAELPSRLLRLLQVQRQLQHLGLVLAAGRSARRGGRARRARAGLRA